MVVVVVTSLVLDVVDVVVVVDVEEVVLDVVVVFVVRLDVVKARALPVVDNISATVGGVTAANRPAFSRNKRRPVSEA